jgi:hypothetical protein
MLALLGAHPILHVSRIRVKQLLQYIIFNSNSTEGLTPHAAAMHLTHAYGRQQKNYTARLAKPFPISYTPLLVFKYNFLATKHVTQRKPAWVKVI